MSDKRTHREVKEPQISARYLADYMAASEQAKRTIVRGCKYQPIARVIQHDEAKISISNYLLDENKEVGQLKEKAKSLRGRLADSEFERDLFDHNADYIERFAKVLSKVELPDADRLPVGKLLALNINGVRVTIELQFKLRRLTRTNKVRVGGGMLRYKKGRALPEEVGLWQSAFLLGYLGAVGLEEEAEPEGKLCITLDAFSGVAHGAPTDAVSRFNNMKAACASIAERWPQIPPPNNAVL